MQKNQLGKLAASNIVLLALSGCATDASNSAVTADKALATTQSSLKTAQSAVDTANTVKQAAGLTDALTQQLGVSSEQATGGAGALLLAAQAQMKPEDFQQLAKSMPEVGALTNMAPKPKESGWGQVASGASALMGDDKNTLGQAAGLVSSFQDLGLSADMVQKYIPVVTDYVSKNAAPQLTKALVSALTGL